MNRFYKQALSLLSLVILFTICIPAQRASAQYDGAFVSYNDFYQNLSPYGQWIDDAQYGYLWSPNVDGSFRPYYTNGHWAMTDYGNTWVSDYPWGWACFHYGRWTYDSYYGWLWIPGSDWGPAWVGWREGDGYYGWAPLGPGYDYASTADYTCPNDWWVFIPPQYLYSANYYHYYYGPHGNSEIIKNSNFLHNTYQNNNVAYVSGPRAKDVEQLTHQPVQVYKVANSAANLNTRTHNNVIKMYRPAEIRPSASINGQRVSPPNVVSAPQALRKPQAISTKQATTPDFHNDIPSSTPAEVPGTHVSEPSRPVPQPRTGSSNYEYDVNRPIAQPQPREGVPQQSRPQPEQSRPQPQSAPRQQEIARPQPQSAPRPEPQQARPQMQQARPQPAPARAAPAPAQSHTESGRR